MNEKIDIKVKKKKEEILKKYLWEILQKMTLNSEGKVTWTNQPMIDINKEIIISTLDIPPQITKELMDRLVLKTVIAIRKQDIESSAYEYFIKELEGQIRKYRDKPKIEYCLVFPLHATGRLIKHKRHFNILGTKFYRVKWDKVQSFSGWDSFLNQVKDYNFPPFSGDEWLENIQSLYPLITYVSARTREEAYENAYTRFELLRVLLNFNYIFRTITYQFSMPQPLGKVFPPPLYIVFNSDGNYDSFYFTVERYNYSKPAGITEKVMQTMKGILKEIERIKDDNMQDLIIGTLIKYGQAIDTIVWRDAFINLWQILESLSLNTIEKNLRMTEVASRIDHLIGRGGTLIRDLLGSLSETRNRLVHRGTFSENGLLEVNLLKSIVDTAIQEIFVRIKDFPSKELLDEFYIHKPLKNFELKTRSEAINSVLRLRRNKN